MTIKDVQITIDPSNTKAILVIQTEDGDTIHLEADLKQVKNIQKIAKYTADYIDASSEISLPALVH